MWWTMLGSLSNFLGGLHMKDGLNRNHTESAYPHDTAHQIRMEEEYRMPPLWASEEAGERDFNISNQHAVARRSKTDVESERLFRERDRMEKKLGGGVKSSRRKAFNGFAILPYRDVIVHGTWFQWTTVPVGFKSKLPRKLAAVNMRQMLLYIAGIDDNHAFVEPGPFERSWLFKLGSD